MLRASQTSRSVTWNRSSNQIGQATGHKLDAEVVAMDMRYARMSMASVFSQFVSSSNKAPADQIVLKDGCETTTSDWLKVE